MFRRRRSHSRGMTIAMLVAILSLLLPMSSSVSIAAGTLECEPDLASAPAAEIGEIPDIPPVEVHEDAIEVTFGYIPVSIFAPVFVAYEKGYFAELGLDVTLEALPGGSDMVLLTSTGQMDMAVSGVGPAYWNAFSQDFDIEIVAPGHMEGNPVASPLMISREACESGAITSVADLPGKRVSVNAPGATELWLDIALQTGGLTISDVDLQFMSFPDAIVALEAGALDAAIVGEPLATRAEQEGLAVRLAWDFDVEGIQPTMIFGNSEWMAENPDAAAGVIAGYLRASQDLTEDFNDPLNLAIIQKYTGVPPELIAASVKPVYSLDGEINLESLDQLQTFFGDRGLLGYDDPIDPATLVNEAYRDAARELLEDGS